MIASEMLRTVYCHTGVVLEILPPEGALMISPVRLVVCIVWFYLCFFCAQKIQFSPLISEQHKNLFILASLVAGPLVFVGLVAFKTVRRSLSTGAGFSESLSQAMSDLGSSLAHLRSLSGSHKTQITIQDASGRDIREIYGRGKHKKERSVLDLTESLISTSVEQRASDILIDPRPDSICTIRFRIDGRLTTYMELDAPTAVALVNSIKAISNLDIAERRRPQDGSFSAHINQLNVSFRVASAGVINGEKLSIRILNQRASTHTLDDIGLTRKQRQLIRDVTNKPAGMVLICGPTGCGKTSTLYAILNEMDRFTRNVVTVEDPIEAILPHTSQIEVNPKADITFSKALRSILRQDPDVICVGEIRDEETAEIALRAAQTGHLVLATLHCDSNTAAILRLLDLGVSPALLAAGLQLIMSQRLLRCLCKHCKKPAEFSPSQVKDLAMKKIDAKTLYASGGCKKCNDTGYLGRTAVADITVVTPKFRLSIAKNKDIMGDLQKMEADTGTSKIKKQGLKKAVSGITTLKELKRTLG
ncbi:MAG: type II/IV secretion system protein [Planctomycetes bacterium]|nr:type II/IV secretion system protein [Planctomycetota bacterium]